MLKRHRSYLHMSLFNKELHLIGSWRISHNQRICRVLVWSIRIHVRIAEAKVSRRPPHIVEVCAVSAAWVILPVGGGDKICKDV